MFRLFLIVANAMNRLFVIEVVKAIARIRGEDEEKVRMVLLENARGFFEYKVTPWYKGSPCTGQFPEVPCLFNFSLELF